MNIPNDIYTLASFYQDHNAKLYVVGGACRDHFMGIPVTDYDLLVVGLDEMIAPVHYQKVISNAPVYLVGDYEIALARREVKVSSGKSGFEFVSDRFVSLYDDLYRRDFTVNSIAYGVLDGVFYDPFGGIQDIVDRVLHPVSSSFTESPERVLRGAAFSARFGFEVSQYFVYLSRNMYNDFYTIPREQLWRFFEKGLSKAIKPSNFLRVLEQTRWVEHFPEISALAYCPQDRNYHPEGDVLTHTGHVMDELAGKGITLLLAGLCHDMGKPATTYTLDGKIVSPGHAEFIEPTISFLDSICTPHSIRDRAVSLVRHHMAHIGVEVSNRYVRRLSKKVHSINDLYTLCVADHFGRPPLPRIVPENLQKIVKIAETLDIVNHEIKPIIMGRDLIDLGLNPSPKFSQILAEAENAQIEGDFDSLEGGILWLKYYLGIDN
jgi:tRNA nucleotidyltransferase (CCA-adding enzyme)